MEKIVFSKPRLAIAVLTAPRQAFEEIVDRRLFGTGLVITAVSGLLALLVSIAEYVKGNITVYDLGLFNPITGLAWLFTASLIIYYVAKLSGGKGSLTDVTTVIGWAHVAAAFGYVIYAVGLLAPNIQQLSALFRYVYFAVICVLAIERVFGFPLWKSSILALCSLLAVQSLNGLCNSIGMAIYPDISRISPYVAGKSIGEPIYLLALAIFGGLSLDLMLRELGWQVRSRLQSSLGVVAAVLVVAASMALITLRLNPIEVLSSGLTAYKNGNYSSAERSFDTVLGVFPRDFQVEFYLAHTYLAAGRLNPAEQQFRDVTRYLKPGTTPSMEAGRAHTGLGAVAYARGDYKKAVSEFENALKRWMNYREASSRKALAHLRLGQLDQAQKAADKALKDGADSAVPYAVLAQVYSKKGDPKKAKDNFGMVTAIDPKLAETIGRNPRSVVNSG